VWLWGDDGSLPDNSYDLDITVDPPVCVEDADADGDGWTTCEGDCDDGDPTLDPSDGDGDGTTSCAGDCDDDDSDANVDDSDGDTFSSCDGDCDDGDPDTFPGAVDPCTGVDNDCDGEPDSDCWQGVAAGWLHSCGVRGDGTLACWGDDRFGQSSPPAGTYSAVAAGGGFDYLYLVERSQSCAIDAGGELVCWGGSWCDYNIWTFCAPPNGSDLAAVSLGIGNGCLLEPVAGEPFCWGSNLFGEETPVIYSYDEISAGSHHVCGLRPNGLVECWGADDFGQASPPAGNYTAVSAGGDPDASATGVNGHTCAILSTNSELVCWGVDNYGQASPPSGAWTAVSAGHLHTCAIAASGDVVCWGDDFYGQASPPTGTFVSVSAGGHHTCGLRPDGTVACWGQTLYGATTVP